MPNLPSQTRSPRIAASVVAPITPVAPARHLAAVEPLDPTPLERVEVIVADGHSLTRAGLCALLEGEDDITVVADAADVAQAVLLSRRLRPQVLLIDTSLPPHGGVQAAQSIADVPELADLSVVMVTASESDACVFGALRAGVRACLVRSADAAELGAAVRAVARGDGMLSPSVARRLIDEFASLPEADRPRPEQLDELTPREVEVVELVAAGLSNRQIAEQLVVTPATAKTHVSRALRKLDARDRAQLVGLAYESGLVVPRPTSTLAHRAPALAAV